MNMGNILGVLAKYPEAGKVKTRLARDIGPQQAAAAYRRLAEDLLKRTAPSDCFYRRIIFYMPEAMMPRFRDWLPEENLCGQRGRDIGERMQNALQEMFERGAKKAIVVGADIPGLHQETVSRAFAQLEGSDAVIGPARDGGYYLIGMKTLHPELFRRGIAWGTGEVFTQTVATLDKLGLSFSTVETLFDVDVLEDFYRWREL